MKTNYILITVAMIAAISLASCKNNSKNNQQPSQEEVQDLKQALADTVLTKLDEIADAYISNSDDGFFTWNIKLTDEEKLVKPDYLLDPSELPTFVSVDQKIAAISIYYIEIFIRESYGMPTEEAREAVSKLAAELNFPYDYDAYSADVKTSDATRYTYNEFKDRGETAIFWKYVHAFMREIDYIVACNPELYLNKVGQENITAYNNQVNYMYQALWTLAPYDEEINSICQCLECKTEEELNQALDEYCLFDNLMESYLANKQMAIDQRNALLK